MTSSALMECPVSGVAVNADCARQAPQGKSTLPDSIRTAGRASRRSSGTAAQSGRSSSGTENMNGSAAPRRERGGPATLRWLGRIQNLPYLAGERVRGEGLLEERDARLEHPVVDDGLVRVAGQIEHPHLRVRRGEEQGSLAAAHAGHDDIGHE